MAKSKTKGVKAAVPYIRRAVEDEYAQEQLRDAIGRLGDVYGRVARQKAAASEDKALYRSLKAAAVSIRRAVGRIEEPPPPKHTRRNVLLIGIGAGAALLLVKRRSTDKKERELPIEPTDYAADAGGPSPDAAPDATVA